VKNRDTLPDSGRAQFRRAIRRLAQRTRRGRVASDALLRPPPTTEWERSADDRLTSIEKALNNQNRWLILTFISIVGDAVYRLGTSK
jgi:hypothetical protein